MDLIDTKYTLLKHFQNYLKKPTKSTVGGLPPAAYFACIFIS